MANEAKSKPIDWKAPDLRRACVEYALQRCPIILKRQNWRLTVTMEEIAQALGMPGGKEGPGAAELLAWCRDKKLRPSGAYAGEIGMGGESESEAESAEVREAALTLAAETAGNVAGGLAGAVPAAIPDPLTALLAEENDTLDKAEREEIARALDAGRGLTEGQRQALALLLRGSDFATRRDVVKALIDFIVPDSAELSRVWESRAGSLKLPAGGVVTAEPVTATVPGFPRLGAQRLVIRERSGRVVRVLLYAAEKETVNGVLFFNRLVPVQCFDETGVGVRMALLSSWVRPSGKQQKGWAPLFNRGGQSWRGRGYTKAAVSFHAKGLQKKVREVTGGRDGMRGVRQKPQRNKGVRKKKGGTQ